MRLVSVLFLSCLAGVAFAADTPKSPEFKPLPPPPALDTSAQDSDLEPQVTITEKKDVTIEEYRAAGKLYMIKVTPKIGPPYYLIDQRGDGQFARQDGPGGLLLSPPTWVIHRF